MIIVQEKKNALEQEKNVWKNKDVYIGREEGYAEWCEGREEG